MIVQAIPQLIRLNVGYGLSREIESSAIRRKLASNSESSRRNRDIIICAFD